MRHITTQNLASFCMDPDEGMWEMDGRPPEPSMVEREQARSGHIENLPSVKTRMPKLLARRHGVELDEILRQLEMGIQIEQEHTTDLATAREIALDHLTELPDYYTRLRKMEESDIQDIVHRSGIQAESRNLDKFETLVTDIALRLVDEEDEMDPATAGMDILDAVNDRMMTESTRRAAGTWYDPMKRALEILESNLPEDVFADMKARMASQADDYLKQRDSKLQTATTQQGVGDPEPEEEEEVTSLGAMAKELENIRQIAMGNSYQLDQKSTQRLAQIINALQDMEKTAGQGVGMRFKKWMGMEAEIRQRAGLTEECDCQLMDAEGEEADASLYSLLNTQRHVLGTMIPEIREIANYGLRQDPDMRKKLLSIADQLASLQWKLHGQREREFGQMWTDVEKRNPAWHGKV